MLRWVRSQWRWLLAFAMSMISQGVLMRFVEPTIPTWALAVWAVAYASSVMWLHESSVLDGRRDAWVQKVTTRRGTFLRVGPAVTVRRDTVAPPKCGDWAFMHDLCPTCAAPALTRYTPPTQHKKGA